MPSVISKPASAGAAAATAIAVRRGIILGLIGKGVFVVPPAIANRHAISKPQAIAWMRFVAFMGLWCGGMRGLLELLVRRSAASGALVGAVAGTSVALATPADRRTMALFVLVRGLESAVRGLARSGVIPAALQLRYPGVAVQCFNQAVLFYSTLYDRASIAPGYRAAAASTLGPANVHGVALLEARMEGRAGDSVKLNAYAASIAASNPGLAAQAVHDGVPCSHCAAVHPGQGCLAWATTTYFPAIFKGAFKSWFMFEAISAAVSIAGAARSGAPTNVAATLLTAIQNSARSGAQVAATGMLGHLSQCALHRTGWRRRYPVLGRHWRLVCAAAAALSGLGMLVEDPAKRLSVALFIMPRALEGLLQLSRRHHVADAVTEAPGGSVAAFAAASAMLGSVFASGGEGFSDLMRGLLTWLWGGALALQGPQQLVQPPEGVQVVSHSSRITVYEYRS